MTEEFSGFLNIAGLDDAVEPELIDAGDYEARVLSAEQQISSKGNPMLKVAFKVENSGKTNPNNVYHYFNLPVPADDEEKVNNKRLQLRRFFQAFDVDYSAGIDLESLIGKTGGVSLSINPAKDDYPASNRIQRFQAVK